VRRGIANCATTGGARAESTWDVPLQKLSHALRPDSTIGTTLPAMMLPQKWRVTMKLGSSFLLAFAMVLGTHFAFAQGEEQSRNDSDPQVAVARCAYAPDETCWSQTPARPPRSGGVSLAQLPGRIPGPPRRVRAGIGYPPPTYQRWHGEVSGSHVAIGAAIGLTLGALIGSRGGAKAAFGFGLVGSGLGAAFGAGIPPMPSPGYRGWPDDEDQNASRSRPRPRRPVPVPRKS